MTQSIYEQAAQIIQSRGLTGPFDLAMILGTGLGNIAEDLSDAVSVSYEDIPGFPKVSVSGHTGRLIAGTLEKKRVLIFQGRAHYYETGQPDAMRVPIGMLASLGKPLLLLTNAAGSTVHEVRPGTLVAIKDHINYSGINPLIGDFGERRFVSLSNAYDSVWRRRLKLAAKVAGITLHEGVYMWFSGPSFETPAEVKMARKLGADLIGMSTVPEVILARYYNLKVTALSVVTNMATGIEDSSPSHKETRDVATAAAVSLRRLLRAFTANVWEQ